MFATAITASLHQAAATTPHPRLGQAVTVECTHHQDHHSPTWVVSERRPSIASTTSRNAVNPSAESR